MGVFGWGNMIGAAISAVASHIEGAQNRRHNAKEARAADARSLLNWKYQMLNGPTLERQALMDAGYNPMLAISGGLSSPSIPSAHSGDSSAMPDVVGSARLGAEIGKDIEKLWQEQKAQAELKTETDEKNLGVIDATQKKIEAETDAIKSQEWRNWVSTVGGVTGNATEALLLYDFVKRNILNHGPFGTKPIGFGKPLSATTSTASKLAPLLKSSAKFGLPALGLGLGATGIYYGMKSALNSKSGKTVVEDPKFQHGNWSR